MITLNIFIVPKNRTIQKQVNEIVDTPDNIVDGLIGNATIPAPPPLPDGGVTIWKMTKGPKGNRPVGGCFNETGFADGETVYLITVPE